MDDRFLRQRVLPGFGDAGQDVLRRAHVAVVGMGGLGCPAALYLATSGVGRLTLVDADHVTATNLPRQVLYGPADIGSPKVDAAAAAIGRVAPWCEVLPRRSRFGAPEATLDGADLVLDATDAWPSRHAVAAAASAAGVRVVWGAAAGWFGQVALLGAEVGLSDIFGAGVGEGLDETCDGQGVAAVTTGLVGMAMATLAVSALVGAGAREGLVLHVDARNGRWRETQVKAREDSDA